MPARRERLLVLGGTAEAAALVRRLARERPDLEIVVSFAGRLRDLPELPARTRIGGFGGAEGLARYLREAGIDRVVDATHPFAAQISAHAEVACAEAGVPLERLERPMWRRRPGDRWLWADDMAMAARLAWRLGRRILLTVGTRELEAFAARGGPFYVVRQVEPPRRRLPFPRHAVVVGRGPFSVADETALLRRFAVDLVVSKASGGGATEAKIVAARRLGIPVLLVRRPTVQRHPAQRHPAQRHP